MARISAPARAGSESEIAVAGGLVFLTGGGPRKALVLRSASITGGSLRTHFRFRAPKDRRAEFYELDAAGGHAAFTLTTVTRDIDQNPRTFSAFSGPTGGPFARFASGAYTTATDWVPLSVQLDGGRKLLTESRRQPSAVRHTIYQAGAAPFRLRPSDSVDVRLAGDLIAYPVTLPERDGVERARLIVAEWRTGVERFHVDGIDPDGFDVAADGRAVAETVFGAKHALLLADGRTPARALVRSDVSRTSEWRRPRFAGSSIVVTESGDEGRERITVVSPEDGRTRRLGPTSHEIGDVDTEGDQAAWIANGCVLVADVSRPGTRTIPPGRCPRSEVFLESGQNATLRRGRVRVVVACLSAEGRFCRGRVSLRLARRGRAVGRARFKILRGRRTAVQLKLSRRGLVAVRRRLGEEDGSALLSIGAVAIDSRGRRSSATQGIGVALPGVDPL